MRIHDEVVVSPHATRQSPCSEIVRVPALFVQFGESGWTHETLKGALTIACDIEQINIYVTKLEGLMILLSIASQKR